MMMGISNIQERKMLKQQKMLKISLEKRVKFFSSLLTEDIILGMIKGNKPRTCHWIFFVFEEE